MPPTLTSGGRVWAVVSASGACDGSYLRDCLRPCTPSMRGGYVAGCGKAGYRVMSR